MTFSAPEMNHATRNIVGSRHVAQMMRLALLPLLAILCIAGYLFPRYFLRGSGAKSPGDAVVSGTIGKDGHRLPYPVRRYDPVKLNPNPKTIERAVKLLWPKKGNSLGQLIHGLHAFAAYPDLSPKGSTSVRDAVHVLTDGRDGCAWFGDANVILESRYGVRHYTDSEGSESAQSHADQALATIGECGIPLDSPGVTSNGHTYTVSNLLADAKARIRPDEEIEWTALAVILYSDPGTSWKNRFGDRYRFDDLVRLLVARQVSTMTCYGTHVSYALSVLRQRNADEKFLSPDLSTMLDHVLSLSVQAARSSQLPDGCIARDWYDTLFEDRKYLAILARFDERLVNQAASRARAEREAYKERSVPRHDMVSCTAHHLEWMLLLPPEMQPDRDYFTRSAGFLERSLAEAPDADVTKFFCPYSHAVHALLVLSDGGADREVPHD